MSPNSIAPSFTGLGFSDLWTHSPHQKTGFVDKKPMLSRSGNWQELRAIDMDVRSGLEMARAIDKLRTRARAIVDPKGR